MSKSGAYYNEFDPKSAAWLRELIKRGLIADGEVDERSIIDVAPDDIRGFTQCHWFAGVGGWSKALRLAGWPDDRPVWTGSPPCQPFSAAGQQRGSADERHLAPHFAELIASDRPTHVFGEQVASAAVFGKPAKGAGREIASQPEWAWIDDLFGRLEAAHYACGASDIPAAGVGAPHLRQRTFFVGIRLADAAHEQHYGTGFGRTSGRAEHTDSGASSGLGHPGRPAGQRDAGAVSGTQAGEHGAWVAIDGDQPVGLEHAGAGVGGLDYSASARHIGSVPRPEGDPRDEARLRLSGAGRELGDVEHPAGDGRESRRPESSWRGIVGGRGDSGLANTDGRDASAERQQRGGEQRQQPQDGGIGKLADPDSLGAQRGPRDNAEAAGLPQGERQPEHGADVPERGGADHDGRGDVRGDGVSGHAGRSSPLAGGWDNPDWLFCRDGKWRPVESSLFGLADGLPAGMVRGGDIVPACYPLAQKGKTDTRRAMRLKGYGNAIVPQAAAVFIKSVMEITQ